MLWRISSGEGDGNFGEENQDFKKWGWGRISGCRKLYKALEYDLINMCSAGQDVDTEINLPKVKQVSSPSNINQRKVNQTSS